MLRKTFWVVFSTTSNFSMFPKKVMGLDASEKVLGRLFDDFQFFDFSDKGYGARCFGKSFGSSFRERLLGQMLRKTFWVIRGFREGFLGHPGGVQEASWGVLGLSGGVRGASWEGLGRSWGDLGAILTRHLGESNF